MAFLKFCQARPSSKKNNLFQTLSLNLDTSIEAICEGLGIHQGQDVPDDITVLTLRRGY